MPICLENLRAVTWVKFKMKKVFILLFTTGLTFSCTRYVIEHVQFGLEEEISLPNKVVILKIDTLRIPQGGTIKKVTAKVPKKD